MGQLPVGKEEGKKSGSHEYAYKGKETTESALMAYVLRQNILSRRAHLYHSVTTSCVISPKGSP